MPNSLSTLFSKRTELDKKSIKLLVKALEKNNLPGFDYLEFKQSLNALAKLDMNEPTTYKSAFATASTLGLTKGKLVETAGYYKTVLTKEKGQFDSALSTQLDKRVTSKEEEVKKKKSQIQKLRAQIESLQADIDGADNLINEARTKLQETKSNFEKTFKAILGEIEKDVDNIDMHI